MTQKEIQQQHEERQVLNRLDSSSQTGFQIGTKLWKAAQRLVSKGQLIETAIQSNYSYFKLA